MTFPTYTATDLAEFTRRDVSTFNATYASTSATQAMLLFKMATCLADWPTDADSALLAKYAVLSVADQIYLSGPYASALASPFASETIGSYSYTKMTAAIAAQSPTGISWFDLAVSKLGVCTDGPELESSCINVFTNDLELYTAADGTITALGPEDYNTEQTPYFYSVPASYDPNGSM